MSGFGSLGAFGRHDPRAYRDPWPGEAIHNSDGHWAVLKCSGPNREIVARFKDSDSAQAVADELDELGDGIYSVIKT
jgi:hypothetical protein